MIFAGNLYSMGLIGKVSEYIGSTCGGNEDVSSEINAQIPDFNSNSHESNSEKRATDRSLLTRYHIAGNRTDSVFNRLSLGMRTAKYNLFGEASDGNYLVATLSLRGVATLTDLGTDLIGENSYLSGSTGLNLYVEAGDLELVFFADSRFRYDIDEGISNAKIKVTGRTGVVLLSSALFMSIMASDSDLLVADDSSNPVKLGAFIGVQTFAGTAGVEFLHSLGEDSIIIEYRKSFLSPVGRVSLIFQAGCDLDFSKEQPFSAVALIDFRPRGVGIDSIAPVTFVDSDE